MTRTTPGLTPPSASFHATPGGIWHTMCACTGTQHVDLLWNGSRTWNSPPQAETLPLGHLGLQKDKRAVYKYDLKMKMKALRYFFANCVLNVLELFNYNKATVYTS
ncbi:hypothetical protein AVEN_219534-1 [Araneus ventricosus]|uniref:Uncharacterized protein n=1 Tax=Araneus ventricosus TaxID=182803 RepID=A0A4Y2BMY3_ARAVE|nr:hypothetical protein AVEN_219534-1 [Araneus ventricosus]